MSSRPRIRRRATGLVRTFVVAAATMAILLVCFSIYQFSQLEPDVASNIRSRRLPAASPEAGAFPSTEPTASPAGLPVGQGVIGAGQDIRITLYPKEGTRSVMELAVKDWAPLEGAENQFVLRQPDVRMRTNDGHAIRVSALRGVLDAHRKGTGGLEPRRGKFSGGVVIEYDRLTETERAALPVERRDTIDPDDLVRIILDEIDFDLEYSKAFVPGSLRLLASDAELVASDVEIRVNESTNRVEHLRLSGNGRLTIREQGARSDGSLAGGSDAKREQVSVVDWLRATLQQRMAAVPSQPSPEKSDTPASRVEVGPDGIPEFRLDGKVAERAPADASGRYYARIEGGVDAVQRRGDDVEARLQADLLEVVRTLTDEDRQRMRAKPSGPPPDAASPADAGTSGGTAVPALETVVLEWRDRVVIDACGAADERCATAARARITATGGPVRVSQPEGDATCARFAYDPDTGDLEVHGDESRPAMVRSAEQGILTGRLIRASRVGDALEFHVDGPGSLVADESGSAASLPIGSPDTAGDRALIEFADSLDARGRVVKTTSLKFTGVIETGQRRLLDEAVFRGRVHVTQGGTRLQADRVAVAFTGSRRVAGREQGMERIRADGQVVFTEGNGRLTCREMDVELGPDGEGRTVPRLATAFGDVTAQEGELSIRAEDRLIAEFGTVASARQADEIPMEPSGDSSTAKERSKVAVRRVRAFGAVAVLDPTEELDLSAEKLDAAIGDDGQMETADVIGGDERPASVRLGGLTVAGQQIKLHVPDQWAEVPGAGRLTFLSRKDLDGRAVAEPIPIAITWTDWMSYRGRENRSVFDGNVHATSRSTTTFDCDHLLVEFDERAEKSGTIWGFPNPIEKLRRPERPRTAERFRKEPAYLLATGRAVALTSQLDPDSGELRNRMRIAGPQLSVNLRQEVSKMIIEGAGNLLLEDFRAASDSSASGPSTGGGLFDAGGSSGPSNTLIEWDELMWYDFSIDQTRFEGAVSLKHFNGEELARIRLGADDDSDEPPTGRATFLTCHVLTVDFLEGAAREPTSDRRVGAITAGRLSQFQAVGVVSLQDENEGLFVTADRVVYWKEHELLSIHGNPRRRAHVVTQKPGQLPNQVSAERLSYNLATGQLEISRVSVKAP